MNKIFYAVIGIVAVLSMGVMFLGAEDSDAAVVGSGTCGTDLTWEYDDETTTLTISGSGTTMTDYSVRGSTNVPPWYTYQSTITNIVLDTPNLEHIGKGAFGREYPSNAYMLVTEFTIPDSVKSIGESAFYTARNMTFNFPSNVETIGAKAFYYTKCNWETLPPLMQNIEPNVFYGCSMTKFYIPEGVVSIGQSALGVHLNELYIPESVTNISASAFSSNNRINHIYYNAINPIIDYSVSSHSPFYSTIHIDEITIGENVQSIPDGMFMLTSSYTPQYPITINWNAKNCNDFVVDNTIFGNRDIPTINFGDNVEYIPAYLTDSIKTTLTTVNMSDSITVIGENAFTGVTDIDNKLILPEMVVGYYTDNTFTTKADLYAGQVGYGAVIQSADVDPNYQDETINLDNVTATMNVSGTEFDLVPEYAIYPTDYTTGTDSGMAGKLLKTIPVFVALALLMGIVVAVRSRMD